MKSVANVLLASKQTHSMPAQPGEAGQAKSITHALRTLLILADARKPLGATEIANELGLHKSSASRILATLRAEKFVDREPDSGRYQIGLGILSLAGAVLSKYRLPSNARQLLELLAEQTGDTVTVSGWNGHDAVNVDQILGSRSITHYSPPGRVNPVHCTATGKVFLAHSAGADIQQVMQGPLTRYTEKTVISRRLLMKELEAVRTKGYAVANGEFLEEVASIASPVFDDNGVISYVIALTLPTSRFVPAHRQELADRLLEVARELSTRNGFKP